MKKYLMFIIALVTAFSTICFGQTKTENKKGTVGIATGGMKSNRQENSTKNTCLWQFYKTTKNDCYKSFAFTLKKLWLQQGWKNSILGV